MNPYITTGKTRALIRPSPGPRKRQSSQYSDPKPQGNRPSTAVRVHRPSTHNLHNDRGKAVRSREKKEQNKGREEKVNVTDFYKLKSYLLTLKVKTVQILIIFRN